MFHIGNPSQEATSQEAPTCTTGSSRIAAHRACLVRQGRHGGGRRADDGESWSKGHGVTERHGRQGGLSCLGLGGKGSDSHLVVAWYKMYLSIYLSIYPSTYQFHSIHIYSAHFYSYHSMLSYFGDGSYVVTTQTFFSLSQSGFPGCCGDVATHRTSEMICPKGNLLPSAESHPSALLVASKQSDRIS